MLQQPLLLPLLLLPLLFLLGVRSFTRDGDAHFSDTDGVTARPHGRLVSNQERRGIELKVFPAARARSLHRVLYFELCKLSRDGWMMRRERKNSGQRRPGNGVVTGLSRQRPMCYGITPAASTKPPRDSRQHQAFALLFAPANE